MAARASGRKKSRTATKSAFVRRLPRNLSAKEVVAMAKQAGISLTASYVYLLRSRAGQGGGQRAARSPVNGIVAADFRRLVVNLGVARAEELLTEVKRRLDRVIAGSA